MPQVPFVRPRCELCNTKIPKLYSLTCCFCSQIKHLKCQGLTKADAIKIWPNRETWSCKECNYEIFPIDLCRQPKLDTKIKKFKSKCAACNGYSYKSGNVRTCWICEGKVHKKCLRDNLGCINCCSELIPGYFCHNYKLELLGAESIKNNNYYNPYSSSHRIQQIGDVLDEAAQNFTVWNDASEFLMKCKYKQAYSEKSPSNNELNLLSLNIQSLVGKLSTMREDIELYQKFDVICLNETNCKLDKFPNGTKDLMLDGFHEPLFQEPARSSGKGGG